MVLRVHHVGVSLSHWLEKAVLLQLILEGVKRRLLEAYRFAKRVGHDLGHPVERNIYESQHGDILLTRPRFIQEPARRDGYIPCSLIAPA